MAKNHISSKIFSSWWLRRLLLGILIFALVMLFALYMIPSSALKPFIHTHIDSEVAFTPDEFFLTPVDFTVTTKDGLTLKGEEYRVEKAKGVVILTAGLYNPVLLRYTDTRSFSTTTIIPSSSTIPAHITKAKAIQSATASPKRRILTP